VKTRTKKRKKKKIRMRMKKSLKKKKKTPVKKKTETPTKKKKGPLDGFNIAITGSKEDLGGHTTKQLIDLIEKKGGLVSTRLSAKTTHLLCGGDDGSEKYIKAIELKIPVIDFYDFQKLLKGEQPKAVDKPPKSPRKSKKSAAAVFKFDEDEAIDTPATPKKKKHASRSPSKTTPQKKKKSTPAKKKQTKKKAPATKRSRASYRRGREDSP